MGGTVIGRSRAGVLRLVIVSTPTPACFVRVERGRFGELETVERLRMAVANLRYVRPMPS